MNSIIGWISTRPAEARAKILSELTENQRRALRYRWRAWARDEQLPPDGNWAKWLILAGRGFGKTRAGAEWVLEQVERGNARRIALVSRTAADIRDVMIEGVSGILSVAPPWNKPEYEPSKRQLSWPNGAVAKAYSADEPNLLRGPGHDAAWADEPAAWRYPESWDQLMLGLREGRNPRCVATTTPRPVRIIRDLIKDPDCVVTRGTTYDNRANLAESWYREIIRKYEGTRIGQQELLAVLLEEVPGSLWKRSQIDANRIKPENLPTMIRIVVGVDPAVTAKEDSNETGIIVKGIDAQKHLYTLDDLSGILSPDEWGNRAVSAYKKWQADRIIMETNQGGDLVPRVIRQIDPNVPISGVHASRGKQARAEPIAALCEQGRDHHCGVFPDLEDQQCNWIPGEGDSPDRVDADVWASTSLLETDSIKLSKHAQLGVGYVGRRFGV